MSLPGFRFDWFRQIAKLPARVVQLWGREFHDVRLILEQHGDLSYLIITSRIQQLAARLMITVAGCVTAAVLLLVFTSLYLQSSNTRLEASHKAVHAALLDSAFDTTQVERPELSSHDMLLLARTIRERDLSIRQLMDAATGTLTEENRNLDAYLKDSGLTEAAIKVIQSNTAVGGFSKDLVLDKPSVAMLPGGFLEEGMRNRELKDILLALPTRMPVDNFYTTSPFGIRKHPISGLPRLHAGVDLVTRSDDAVFPVKSGKVFLARFYNDYGNTVIVQHERGIETLYGHLARIDVKEGQDVNANTVLGLVGNTGSSTGKHLHFEVSIGGYPVDPLKVITTAQNVQQVQR